MELVAALIVTPGLIGAASLGARRWGPSVGGWLLSFPVITAPVLLVLALEQGLPTCQRVAEGALAGCIPIMGFCIVYSWLARAGLSWPICLTAGCLCFALVAVPMLQAAAIPVSLLFVIVLAALGFTIRLMPAHIGGEPAAAELPRDIPIRMLLGGLVVLAVELAVPVVGSGAAGILSMIPITTSIVSVFAQRSEGVNAAVGVQRGLLVGVFGTAAFLGTVGVLIEDAGLAVAFLVGLAVLSLVEAAALKAGRRSQGRPAKGMAASDGAG